jgi:hypothetical protein
VVGMAELETQKADKAVVGLAVSREREEWSTANWLARRLTRRLFAWWLAGRDAGREIVDIERGSWQRQRDSEGEKRQQWRTTVC